MPAAFAREAHDASGALIPHKLNAEIANYVGMLNGRLDRDNIPTNTADATKFELDSFHAIAREQTDTPQTKTHVSNNHLQDWVPIPDGAGNDWQVAVECVDCSLELALSVTVEDNALASEVRIAIGIFVDGDLVACSGISQEYMRIALCIDAEVPVGAGTRIVEFKYTLHDEGASAAITLNFEGRSYWVRQVRR